MMIDVVNDGKLTLIGVGGIGSMLAPLVAMMRYNRYTLIDPDVFGPENLHSQLLCTSDALGKPKVEVTAETIRQRLDVPIQTRQESVTADTLLRGIVICGVDSQESRNAIWSAVLKSRDCVPLYLDGRLSTTDPDWFTLHIVDLTDARHIEIYEKWMEVYNKAITKAQKTLSVHLWAGAKALLAGAIVRTLQDRRCGKSLPHLICWSKHYMEVFSCPETESN